MDIIYQRFGSKRLNLAFKKVINLIKFSNGISNFETDILYKGLDLILGGIELLTWFANYITMFY